MSDLNVFTKNKTWFLILMVVLRLNGKKICWDWQITHQNDNDYVDRFIRHVDFTIQFICGHV